MYKADPKNQFPSLITLFSAPNYCDDHGNKGAILEYGLVTIEYCILNPLFFRY